MASNKKLTIEERKQLEQLQSQFKTNDHNIFVLEPKDLAEVWVARAVSEGKQRKVAEQELETKAKGWGIESIWELMRGTGALISGKTALATDSILLTKLAKDLIEGGAIFTQYRVSCYNGKNYLIFKGNHRARALITGTRYLAENTKLINIGVGRLGAANAVVKGVRITIVLTLAFRAIDTLLREEATWHDFIGASATDLVKVGVAGGASFAAGAWVASGAAVGAVAIGPLFAAIAVGFAVGYTLEKIDDKTGFTKAIIKSLRDADTNLRRDLKEVERQWNWYHRSPEASIDFWMRVFGAQW
ncbi:MAG: hypothetical protein GY799_06180 [Desulfobulbaceae bacterium]|nr:hypothetical protein [Desulfobulbaceae bacterium]